MSGHSTHRVSLGKPYHFIASWELAADTAAGLPETDGPLRDGSNLYLAAETAETYWTAQADLLRYGAALHASVAETRRRYEAAENVSAAYNVAVDGAEAATRLKGLLQDAGSRLKQASADTLLIENGMDPETAAEMRTSADAEGDPPRNPFGPLDPADL